MNEEPTTRMTSLKPHILRTVYTWVLENNLTPHILVNANVWGVKVPQKYIEDGKIVLNIEPSAVSEFELGNDKITFQASFHGVNQYVMVPVRAVSAIYAAENGRGQLFKGNDFEEDNDIPKSNTGRIPPQKPTLTLVAHHAKKSKPVVTMASSSAVENKNPWLKIIK